MILIFDTFCGLCNQILDIQCALNFSINHNLKFTFRYCNFRNTKDNRLFFDVPFQQLFNPEVFKIYTNYIDYNSLKNDINKNNNTYNYENKRAIELFSNINEVFEFIKNNKYKYIVLKQFFPLCNSNSYLKKYYIKIKPNSNLFSIFLNLKNNFLPEKYNFIHYRYESDFTSFFNIETVFSIDNLLKRIKFKNPNLKIYIACYNIKSLSKTHFLLNDIYSYKNILFKDDIFEKYNIKNLNFEEHAFIDFLIGVNSCEVYGHKKSSFSSMLNLFKNTKNYYNII